MYSASIIVVPYEDDSFLANPFFKANNSMMMHKIGTELSLDFQWGHRVNMLNYFFDSSTITARATIFYERFDQLVLKEMHKSVIIICS